MIRLLIVLTLALISPNIHAADSLQSGSGSDQLQSQSGDSSAPSAATDNAGLNALQPTNSSVLQPADVNGGVAQSPAQPNLQVTSPSDQSTNLLQGEGDQQNKLGALDGISLWWLLAIPFVAVIIYWLNRQPTVQLPPVPAQEPRYKRRKPRRKSK